MSNQPERPAAESKWSLCKWSENERVIHSFVHEKDIWMKTCLYCMYKLPTRSSACCPVPATEEDCEVCEVYQEKGKG